jgi:mono/diheme cytochrome c family protein
MKAGLGRRALLVLAAAGVAGACGDHEFEPPSQEERSARADSVYSPVLFDSIAWASDSLRLQSGNLVFADECRRCHGPLGRGDTEYARNNDIDVPSLVEPDWAYAGLVDSVRHRIFVGHQRMPNWGVVRLTPRQIDAAAAYILDQLRPEVLGDTLDAATPAD